MSLTKVLIWISVSTLVKILAGLIIVKLLAISFGPEGIGRISNFRQLVTILGVVAGAGIFNGVTKYVAQYQQHPKELTAIVGTASIIVLIFSLFVTLILSVNSELISRILFGHAHYQDAIRIVAFLQFGVAWSNLAMAVMRGFRDTTGNALSLIFGSIIGVFGYLICYCLWGYQGALIGLAVIPTIIVIPAMWILIKRNYFSICLIYPRWNRNWAQRLVKFTLMALISSAIVPISWIIRNLLATLYSWHDVGLWQGITTVSNAWLQCIISSFTIWVLPTLSSLEEKEDLLREVLNTLRFVLPLASAVGFFIWLFRDIIIYLFFSNQFYNLRDLFAWHLIGDVLKIGSYVFSYLVISKASLFFYIISETIQLVLLTIFSYWLIPLSGVVGAAQAYMITYIVYFLLCLSSFFIYFKKYEKINSRTWF